MLVRVPHDKSNFSIQNNFCELHFFQYYPRIQEKIDFIFDFHKSFWLLFYRCWCWRGRHNGALGQNVYAQILMNAIIVFKSSHTHTHTHTPHQMPTRCCVKNRISSGALFRTKRFSTPKLLIIFQKFPLLPFPSTLRIHFLHVIWCQPQFTCFYDLFPFSTFVLNYYVCSKLQKENWFFSRTRLPTWVL